MFSNFQSSYNYSEDEDDTDRGEPFTHVSSFYIANLTGIRTAFRLLFPPLAMGQMCLIHNMAASERKPVSAD